MSAWSGPKRELRRCDTARAAPWLVKYYVGDVQFGSARPPADSPPSAAFVDDSAAITDKRLDSLSIFFEPRPRAGADNVSE
jgi:hypothetical protein